MANESPTSPITPREAIADTLHRCVLGIDSNNRALFSSSFLHNETTSVIAGGHTLQGWPTINDFFNRVFEVVTTHITSNIRVDLKEGADTASMIAHAIAYHMKHEDAMKREDTSYTAGCLYFIDVVKDGGDGLWRIKRWEIRTLWTTGDIAVLHG